MLTTLRQSALRSWIECPARFYSEYILGVEGEPSHHLAYGSAYHKAAESFHKGEAYNEVILADYPFAKDFFPADMLEVDFLADATHPFTGEKLSIPISGTIDAIGEGGIYDHKTATKPYNQRKVDAVLGMPSYYGTDTTGLQATYYCYAYWLMTGKVVPFTFVVKRKNPGPRTKKFDTFTTERDAADFAALWELCSEMLEDIQWRTDWPCRCYNKKHQEQVTGAWL